MQFYFWEFFSKTYREISISITIWQQQQQQQQQQQPVRYIKAGLSTFMMLFLEWEMFRTGVEEVINTHVVIYNLFFKTHVVYLTLLLLCV
jgi:hypothetical protein